jgi:hypothetical protein
MGQLHKGNANQNYTEIPSHPSKSGCHEEYKQQQTLERKPFPVAFFLYVFVIPIDNSFLLLERFSLSFLAVCGC